MKRLVALLFAIAVGLHAAAGDIPGAPPPHEIAVTIDDLLLNRAEVPLPRVQAMTESLLAGLLRNGIPAVAFVNESKLYREGEVDARIALLRRWRDAGAVLGNHTFSHPSFAAISKRSADSTTSTP